MVGASIQWEKFAHAIGKKNISSAAHKVDPEKGAWTSLNLSIDSF